MDRKTSMPSGNNILMFTGPGVLVGGEVMFKLPPFPNQRSRGSYHTKRRA